MRRVALLTVALAVAASAGAGGATAPFDIQVPLLLKALTYDRNLKTRAGDQVRIAIVVPAKASRAPAEELLAAVKALPDRTVSGMPVTFEEVTSDALDQTLRERRWAAAYVMPGFGREEIAQIKRVCESRQVLAVATSPDEVDRGLAFGVGAQGGKPQIVVNLPSSKASGTEFDLALLRLARVIQ